jgi:hypothetical protein
MTRSLNSIEEEVVFLKAIYDLIDSMVNFEMLSVVGGEPYSSVMFMSPTHHQLFMILLTDFLSQTDKDAPIGKNSYVGALKSITTNPNFNVNNSVDGLRREISQFRLGSINRFLLRFGSPPFQERRRLTFRESLSSRCAAISQNIISYA